MADCAICRTAAGIRGSRRIFSCPRCGNYELAPGVGWVDEIPDLKEIPDHQVRLSGWVRDQNAVGVVPRITPEILRRVIRMRLPGLRQRANRALGVIAGKHPNVRKIINLTEVVTELELQGVTYSCTSEEATQLIDILLDDGYLNWAPGGSRGRDGLLTAKGLLAAEALGASGSGSQGFVAMSFDPSLREVWINGFDPGIRAAGYDPVRIDDKDYVGGITDEMIAEIRRSCFVVADYTGHRNNVYFEAGFALGLGLTVIQTCRANEAANLHFDIRHINTLEWNSPAELVEGLNKRIRAVVGIGPNADPW
jgi:hypothetical protein